MLCVSSPAPACRGAFWPAAAPAAAGPVAPARVFLSDEEWQALLWPLDLPMPAPCAGVDPVPPKQEVQP